MAGNLAAFNKESNKNPYMNYNQVRVIASNYAALNNNIAEGKDTVIYEQLKDELMALKQSLQAEEQVIYKKLCIDNPKTGMKLLQQNIENWNKSVVRFNAEALASEIYPTFVGLDVNQVVSKLQVAINSDPNLQKELFNTEANTAEILNKFSSIVAPNEKVSFQNRSDRGINTQLKISKNPDGTLQIVPIGKGLKLGMGLKLTKMLSEADPSDNSIHINSKKEGAKAVCDIVIAKSNLGDQRMKQCLQRELILRSSRYDIYKSIASLKGWLEESIANAGFNYIFNNKNASLSVGGDYNIFGKQSSIDSILFYTAGVQIKSWSPKVMNNGDLFYTLDNQIGLNTFITNAGLNSGAYSKYGQAILKFFSAATYNKPNDNYQADQPTKHQSVPYESFYNTDIEPQATLESFSQFDKLFNARIDRILKISGVNTIKTASSPFKGYNFKNTFWWINGNLVPSSILIDGMLQALDKEGHSQQNPYISYETTSLEDGGGYTWPSVKNTPTTEKLSQRWKVGYTVQFMLSKIFESAERYFNS